MNPAQFDALMDLLEGLIWLVSCLAVVAIPVVGPFIRKQSEEE